MRGGLIRSPRHCCAGTFPVRSSRWSWWQKLDRRRRRTTNPIIHHPFTGERTRVLFVLSVLVPTISTSTWSLPALVFFWDSLVERRDSLAEEWISTCHLFEFPPFTELSHLIPTRDGIGAWYVTYRVFFFKWDSPEFAKCWPVSSWFKKNVKSPRLAPLWSKNV